MFGKSKAIAFLRQVVLSFTAFLTIYLLLFAFIFIGIVAGIVRYFTHWNADFSLVFSTVICLTFFLWSIYLSRQRRLSNSTKSLARFFCGTALVTYSIYCLYNVFFDSFVSLGSPDAGNHVQLSRIFLYNDPTTYNGFVGLYSFVYLLQKFGFDTFDSFKISFYTVVALVASTPFFLLALKSNNKSESANSPWTESALVLLLSLPVFYRILLPSLHYNQGDGFWAHLFGLVPLISLCLSYGILPNLFLRMAALILGIIFYRFTYGLNLADLILTAGLLLFWEHRKEKPIRITRNLLLLTATCLAAGSIFAYTKLYVLNDVVGAIVPPNLFNSLAGQILTITFLFVYYLKSPSISGSFSRVIRFIGLYISINVVVQITYLVAGLPQFYYFQKYNLHAVFLGCIATPLLLADLFQRGFTEAIRFLKKQKPSSTSLKSSKLHISISLCIGVLALIEITNANRVYKGSFLERAWGEPPSWNYNAPLVDRKAEKLIINWLKEENKTFGGLIVCNYSIVNFMNASLGYNRGIDLLRNGGNLPKKDQCVFWLDNDAALDALAHHKEKGTIKSYDSVVSWKKHDQTRCISYTPKHELTEQRLCGLCL